MRNFDKKRENDRIRYAEKRQKNPLEVREAERLRKAAQRKRKRDPYSQFNTSSIDEPGGLEKLERATVRGEAQLV